MQGRISKGISDRLRGPGGLYNLGNAVGLFGGVAVALISTDISMSGSTASAVYQYLLGSPAAVALTLATLIFFWGGEEYHQAWVKGFPPDERRKRNGDLSSAVGASILALGFFLLGNPLLAATSGVLHAAGKLGSALNFQSTFKLFGRGHPVSDLCREIVVISRIPAIALAGLDLGAHLSPGGTIQGTALAAILLLCCACWTAADMLLLPTTSVLSTKRLFTRPIPAKG